MSKLKASAQTHGEQESVSWNTQKTQAPGNDFETGEESRPSTLQVTKLTVCLGAQASSCEDDLESYRGVNVVRLIQGIFLIWCYFPKIPVAYSIFTNCFRTQQHLITQRHKLLALSHRTAHSLRINFTEIDKRC